MQRLSVWVGTGLLTAGVSAAMLAGAGVAVAEDGTAASSTSTDSSSSADSAKSPADTAKSPADTPETKPDAAGTETDDSVTGPEKPETESESDEPGAEPTDTEAQPEESETEPAESDEPVSEPEPATDDEPDAPAVADEPDAPAVADEPDAPAVADEPDAPAVADDQTPTSPKSDTPKKTPSTPAETEKPATGPADEAQPAEVAESVTAEPVVAASPVADERTAAKSAVLVPQESAVSLRVAEEPPVTAKAKAQLPAPIRFVTAVVGAVVNGIGSLAINTLQALEALITGPPVLPPNSTVTVRSSTILLSNGQRVQANWYYPDTEEPPERMILLQHGLLALGPMYSYTAAGLAERTNSIVVTPTLTSNFFAGDQWLGGAGMASAVADLFVGDRAALTASALAAGYADKYGLDPATAALPQKFGLAGHSLGGKLVSGAAGYLAENGAADDLVGVITLDGVPTGSTLPDALDKLAAYEAATGHYIPIREIGAPWNFLNSVSNVKQSLNAARPDRFNGVVLRGGVHMDSMRGGNPIIQFAAYVVAGFPKAQNPPAVEALAVTWFEEWFNGQTDIGDDLAPGSVIEIPTPNGTARGVVIGARTEDVPESARRLAVAV